MVSDYFNESHRYTSAPTLRCFRFDEKFHTDDTERRVLIEEMCNITQSSREESRVGIETDEDIASRAFGPAVDGGAESAVAWKSKQSKIKFFLKNSEGAIFTGIIIDDNTFIFLRKYTVPKR